MEGCLQLAKAAKNEVVTADEALDVKESSDSTGKGGGQHEAGSVVGAAALVAGTTIGAGILALPAATQTAGFVPSCSALLTFYAFSVVSGLLLAEVNINTMCELGGGAVSLQSMAERTLGKTGSRVASAAYIFLHYSLLVAYIARAGGAITSATGLPLALTGALFAATLGGVCYASPPRTLDAINSTLLALVIAAFVGLVTLAAPGVSPDRLAAADWPEIVDTLPVIALAFVYQNVVPVVITSLEGDIGKVRTAIIGGAAVPLVMFLGWEGAILGSVPPGVAGQFSDPVAVLRDASPLVAPLIEAFSFLAIATSFIGFVLGLTDFLGDALTLPAQRQLPVAYALTLLPPYALALTFPDIFFAALDSAGTYGVLVLFGLLPAAMAWSERYGDSTLTRVEIVPGGRGIILAVGGTAATIIGYEMFTSLSTLL